METTELINALKSISDTFMESDRALLTVIEKLVKEVLELRDRVDALEHEMESDDDN